MKGAFLKPAHLGNGPPLSQMGRQSSADSRAAEPPAREHIASIQQRVRERILKPEAVA